MELQTYTFKNGCTNPSRKELKNLSSLLLHKEQFQPPLVGVKFTTMGKHKEKSCEQKSIFILVGGFLVQNSD